MNYKHPYIFDYGATIDTRGEHWSHVFWRAYHNALPSLTWQQMWEAYVHTERRLGNEHIIQPDDTFLSTLHTKIGIHLQYMSAQGWIALQADVLHALHDTLTSCLYEETKAVIAESRQVLQRLHSKGCPMILVSNFYGNIRCVLREFDLQDFFLKVIESAEVGIRKPDPRIWQLGIDALQEHDSSIMPQDITVVGDHIDKDIIPAQQLGCHTIHITNGLRKDIRE